MENSTLTLKYNKTIFIVDDDDAAREGLAAVFSFEGYNTKTFSDADSFILALRSETPGCIILDVVLDPGTRGAKTGLDVLKEIHAETYPAPIFIISGLGDIPMAIESIKNGALDFIEKPFDAETIVSRVHDAIKAFSNPEPSKENLPNAFSGRKFLTPRERKVLALIVGGASNKEAGRILGTSAKSIEIHRVRLMERLKARNTRELVDLVLGANL